MYEYTKSAFLALTRGAARFIGSQNELGSIQPCMLADLVVFNGKLLDAPSNKLLVMTRVGAEVAYESPELYYSMKLRKS